MLFNEKEARCRNKNQDLFFPKDDRNVKEIKAVKAICKACPLMLPCRVWGMVTDSVGIFGATTREDRIRVLSFALVLSSSLGEEIDKELGFYDDDHVVSPLVKQYKTRQRLAG